MSKLNVNTNPDAEIFVMDGTLSLVGRGVGNLEQEVTPGLYKIKVDRGGAVREQIVSAEPGVKTVNLFVDEFPAIAPIGPLFESGTQAVENIAQKALGPSASAQTVLLLSHWDGNETPDERPFDGVRLFPWRTSQFDAARRFPWRTLKDVIGLGHRPVATWRGEKHTWAATSRTMAAGPGTYILELRIGSRVSRQPVLLADNWQTRIFLRRRNTARSTDTEMSGKGSEPRIELSIQMAKPFQPVVYADHLETIEVARNALEQGRRIFVSQDLIRNLLWGKFENPIAGITGLHLFLDAKARSDAGDRTFDLAAITSDANGPEAFVAKVLNNLGDLLGRDTRGQESPDLTALRVRAGVLGEKTPVTAPPMFRASWDVLKSNAGPGGKVSIEPDLWRSASNAVAYGPYIAWAPKEPSFLPPIISDYLHLLSHR